MSLWLIKCYAYCYNAIFLPFEFQRGTCLADGGFRFFFSYCMYASSYNAMVLIDRVDFTRAFGDLQMTIDFLGAKIMLVVN